MRSRIIGWTTLGTIVGLLVGIALMTPLALYLRTPMGWDDSRPDILFLAAGASWLLWTAYLGGRFGYKVGVHEDQNTTGVDRRRTWTGPGWSLTIEPESVSVTSREGTQEFTGDRLGRIFLTRTGTTWTLELPDDSIRVLEGLEPAEAEDILRSLGG